MVTSGCSPLVARGPGILHRSVPLRGFDASTLRGFEASWLLSMLCGFAASTHPHPNTRAMMRYGEIWGNRLIGTRTEKMLPGGKSTAPMAASAAACDEALKIPNCSLSVCECTMSQ